MRMMLRGKVHRATVTQADVDYIGSIAIDETLMDAAGILEWEQVDVLDITNGARLTTYALPAPALRPKIRPSAMTISARPKHQRRRPPCRSPPRREGAVTLTAPRAPVAQGIERSPPERKVAGSIPAGRIWSRLRPGAALRPPAQPMGQSSSDVTASLTLSPASSTPCLMLPMTWSV